MKTRIHRRVTANSDAIPYYRGAVRLIAVCSSSSPLADSALFGSFYYMMVRCMPAFEAEAINMDFITA